MKRNIVVILLVISIPGLHLQSFAQKETSVRFFEQFRTETQVSYNFFVGPDAADFNTSVKGFGSGILDFFGSRGSADILNIGTDHVYVSVGAGFAVLKYRFANNLIFNKSPDNTLSWAVDPDTAHNYVNSFFGYGKSKLITTSFYFPVDLNIALGKNVEVTAGAYMDINLTARYKTKYLVGEDKVKEIIRSAEFRNFNPSITKFGVNTTLRHKKWDVGLSASYCLTPFFKPGLGPDIHEARISATYALRNLKNPGRKEEQ